MAILVTNAVQVARFANALYGIKLGSTTNAAVNADIANIGLSATVNAYYDYSFGSKTSAEVAAIMLANLGLTGNTAAAAYVEGQLNAAGSAKGVAVLNMLNAFSNLESDATFGAAATAWNATIVSAQAYTASNTADVAATATTTQTFTLTTGIDTPANTAGNDTYDATENSAGNATLTAMDVIDGGAGTDTLKVVDATAIDTAIVGLSVKNVENISLTSGAGVTTNTSTWTGATSLTIAAGDDVAATAAATTDVTVAASALTTDGTAAAELAVNGGNAVTVTAADTSTTGAASANQIIIGGTTAAAGAVKVTYTETISDAADAGVAGSTIAVTGGSSVEVNSLAVVGAASAAADVLTIGQIDVTGNASTASVVVKQSAATAAYAAAGDKIKITNGAVNVLDVNRTSTTKAGVISSVTLENFGAATVNSGALTTLNLSGKGTSVNAGTLGALTTPANTALAVNVNGLTTTGTVTVDSDIKTLNVASSTAASTINLLTNGATALNISGDAKLTLTGQTAVAKQVITVTNTAGAVLGTELATDAQFTGGAGADSILLAATTKAQDMGAGDDVVTVSVTALGAGGSVNGGAGTDTLVANTNGSNFIADPAFGGFETLRVAGAAAQGSHNANGFSAIEIGATAGASTFTSVASNVGLTMLAGPTGGTTVTLANATGTADVFGLTLKSDGNLTAGSVTVAGVETVNITNTDSLTTTASGINTNTITLVTNAAKTVTVSGNAGLTITNDAGNTAITSFDASAVTGAAADAAALAVTFVSNNATVGAVVTIKGGSGNDSLTGNAANKDVIDGGAGDDTLVYGGGADEFTGGAGADTFDVNAVGTSSVYLTITDAAKTDKIDFVTVSTGTIADATLGAKVTLGSAATLAQYLDAAAAGNGGTNALVKWFQFGGDTYVVLDNAAGATFVSGTDSVVKLTGTIDLSTSALATEVLTLA